MGLRASEIGYSVTWGRLGKGPNPYQCAQKSARVRHEQDIIDTPWHGNATFNLNPQMTQMVAEAPGMIVGRLL